MHCVDLHRNVQLAVTLLISQFFGQIYLCIFPVPENSSTGDMMYLAQDQKVIKVNRRESGKSFPLVMSVEISGKVIRAPRLASSGGAPYLYESYINPNIFGINSDSCGNSITTTRATSMASTMGQTALKVSSSRMLASWVVT